MKLLVGLGNPGGKYESTRHNVGFWWCDQLATKLGVTFEHQSKFFGDVARAKVNGADLRLLKPQTFMNESGRAVKAISSFYDIDVSEILVVHDELDLEPGIVRLKQGGGHGGHNGIRDVGRHLSLSCWRLRIGINKPDDKNKVIEYVLGKPSKEDKESIFESIHFAINEIDDFFSGNGSALMNKLNGDKK